MNRTISGRLYTGMVFIVAVLCVQFTLAQGLIVYRRDTVAYMGFGNIQRFVVPGVDANKVRFTTDNGTVVKYRDMIYFRPAEFIIE